MIGPRLIDGETGSARLKRASALLILLFFARGCAPQTTSPEIASYGVQGTELSVSLDRRPANAVHAEYHRTLRLRARDSVLATVSLFKDTGGYSRTNLYTLGDSAYLARDADASYVIHPGRREIRRDAKRRTVDALTFVGSFDVDARKVWRFIPAPERGELPTEFQGG